MCGVVSDRQLVAQSGSLLLPGDLLLPRVKCLSVTVKVLASELELVLSVVAGIWDEAVLYPYLVFRFLVIAVEYYIPWYYSSC